ncbi:MAG: hypothetical protein IJO33_05820 [Bacilli bacterium]|nr:hypothetical protein [Bacilli bacterium]
MKKYFMVALLAILVGGLFAFYMFSGVDKIVNDVINDNDEITVFQSGVFKDKSNALLEKNKYEQAIVVQDGNLYRVYIGVSYDEEVTLAYETYFKKHNYHYYRKKIDVSNNYLTNLKKYEELIKRSFNEDTYININKDLLAKLSEELI